MVNYTSPGLDNIATLAFFGLHFLSSPTDVSQLSKRIELGSYIFKIIHERVSSFFLHNVEKLTKTYIIQNEKAFREN